MLKVLEKGMLDYIEDGEDNAYTTEQVAECTSILRNYLTTIASAKSTEEGLQIVKRTVLRLNDLNERCDEALIETMQREEIWDIMQTAYVEQALAVPESGDVTEEWREW